MRAKHLQSNMEVNNGSNSNGKCGALVSLCVKGGGGSLPIKDSSVMFYRSMREEFPPHHLHRRSEVKCSASEALMSQSLQPNTKEPTKEGTQFGSIAL